MGTYDIRRSRSADVESHPEDVEVMGVTNLVEQHRDAKLIDLLLTVYAIAGSCSSLRTAVGERPVQRTKA
jgi:hypothetical protein